MDANGIDRSERRAEPLLLVMSAGIVGITGVIAAMALIGEWWFLAATMATLLASAGGVVAMILRLLAQASDTVPARRTARRPLATEPTEAATGRRPAATAPALRAA
jgi:hypothetical protein